MKNAVYSISMPDDGFITVPEVTLPSGIIVPPFRVAKYPMSRSQDGKAVSVAEEKPWTNITFAEAKSACIAAGGQLLFETKALAIAHDIEGQDINWTGGKVGDGQLFQGVRKGNVSCAQVGDYESPDADERSWHQLSNGERIYHFAGNIYTWIFDDVQGDDKGVVAKAFAKDSPSIATAPHPSQTKGMGWFPSTGSNWSGYALIRGGFWYSESRAGVFRLNGGYPENSSSGVGFRCTLGL